MLYLDSSAFVKLVVSERESDALTGYLAVAPRPASSALTRVEVHRAVMRYGAAFTERARAVLVAVDFIVLDDDVLDAAAMLEAPLLRSLDAIHVASALALGPAADVEVVTYDRRMADAAEAAGLRTVAPV